MLRIDLSALVLVVGSLLTSFFLAKYFKEKKPTLFYSALAPLKKRLQTLRERFSRFPRILWMGALGALLLAFLDPHLLVDDTTPSTFPPKEGMAIFLALDQSGSMGKVVDQVFENDKWRARTKFDLVKVTAAQFVEKLPKDLVGIVAFARSVQVVAPLTLDHAELLKRIQKLDVVQDKSQDGTAIGYAIYKISHLIAATKSFQDELPPDERPPYEIRSASLIVITDGLQDPSALDRGNRLRTIELEEAGRFAKEKGIRVYIVNVEPRFKEEQFAPNRREMERVAQETGGELILIDQLESIGAVLNEINRLEKSRIYGNEGAAQLKKIPFYPYLIGMGLLLIGLGVLFNETIWRKIV